MRRAVLPHTAVLGEVAGSPTFRDIENYEDAATVPGLIVYRFDAPLSFANADVFRNEIQTLVTKARDPVRQRVADAASAFSPAQVSESASSPRDQRHPGEIKQG